MKKKTTLIMVIIGILFIAITGVVVVGYFGKDSDEPEIDIDPIEETRFENLKKALLASTYFKDSKITIDDNKEVANIDDKYDIYIKSGYYMMTIDDSKLENRYCEIVDAIEQSLGMEPGKSIETCKETLNGSINIGGISAEIYDTYKVLTVNSDEQALLYNVTNSHASGDIISIEEVNYNIKIDDYILTSMNTGYTKEAKLFNVCGHIYNDSKKAKDEFKLTIYDANRNALDEKTYSYSNDTSKYLSFCVEYEREIDDAKFYSIEVVE